MAVSCKKNYINFTVKPCSSASTDIELDAKAQQLHRIDSLNLLLYTFLLTLTVLTIWLFKHRRLRFLHETGLAVIYGLIVGALIRYTGSSNSVTHVSVHPQNNTKYNLTVPPDTLWFKFPHKHVNSNSIINSKTYSYTFRGEIVDVENSEIDLKATFDPEIFFNIILPPIIFHAGYSLKRRYFFRNLGAILTYAIIGTTISSFVVGSLMYGLIQIMPHLKTSFTFLDTLYFGALISSTDPLTILAIFNDLHVDVNLYALVFGESVLNDAVSIVLSGSIQNYGKKYQSNDSQFETYAFFRAFGDFIEIFSFSLIIGAVMGCITALISFYYHSNFPLLESALFVLMSYSSFLIAEVSDLTGVVAVLFCGICQAHYTYNNLSDNSRTRTKHLFQLLNFLAENFIFCYIGVSMFTFPKHHFDPFFIFSGFICAAIGRAANIYPLSLVLNLGRKPKISTNFQHMLFFAGLRGAMSFALAIRNTLSEARQAMLTTTSLIVIATVIIQGGATMQLLTWFNIPVGVEEEVEVFPYANVRNVYNSTGIHNGEAEESSSHNLNPKQMSEKAFLARIWGDFDTKYMKPFLTDSRPTLLETLPVCCNPLARLLTTTAQLTQEGRSRSRHDSDSDICLEENAVVRRDLGLGPGIVDTIIRLQDNLDGNNI
ncbi:sodium/hydrogen exchanger, putative [Pediculus humanus corporis]|uniref:Sodium/hydrogen exchanger n=1 Tax=Pediculus humanus subsp. corporis TaxID=121224 RepID=E0W4B8_PEDHC|nr:sodium/hydrogen exchanger, putative [Pediculus humanus corporis]EEB20474.1 sodium/hydrogen exchanger, putative [Pediculus humanus corporis]